MDEHDNFTVGETVMVGAGYAREIKATVRKVTAARVTVETHDGEIKVLHRSKYGRPFACRRVTERDLAHENWLAEMKAWEIAKPRTKQLGLSQWVTHGDYHVRVDGGFAATLNNLQQIADEAHAIREWLRKRPEGPR